MLLEKSAEEERAERNVRIRTILVALNVVLLALMAWFVSRNFSWLVHGTALSNEQWQKMMCRKLLPFFHGLFTSFGEPPEVAVRFATAAATRYSTLVSYKEFMLSFFGLCGIIATIISKGLYSLAAAVIELQRLRRSK